MGKALGEGEFGRVVQGELTGVDSNSKSIVAVKMLKANHSDDDMKDLVSEMEVIKKIGRHENIINLLGCCAQNGNTFESLETVLGFYLNGFLDKGFKAFDN